MAVHDFIAMQGDPCRSLFLLYSGQVRTVMSGPDGKQIIMSDLKAPILLAPAFIFATNNHFSSKCRSCCSLRSAHH